MNAEAGRLVRLTRYRPSQDKVDLGLVAPSGQLALLIGSSQVNEAQAILPEFSWRPEVPIPGSKARALLVGAREPH